MVDFGEKLKDLRKNAKLSQEQLAQRLGITKGMISSYETSMRMPSYTILVKLARIFHVSTDFLLGLDRADTLNIAGLSTSQKALLAELVSEFEKVAHAESRI